MRELGINRSLIFELTPTNSKKLYGFRDIFRQYLKDLNIPFTDEFKPLLTGNIYPTRYNGDLSRLERYDGVNWQEVPVGSDTIPLSSLTAAVATNSITSGYFPQEWKWTGLPASQTAYGLKLSQTEGATASTLFLEGTSNSWSGNILRIEDVNSLAGNGGVHTIIKMLSPNLPVGSTQDALAFGKSQSTYNMGYIAYVHTNESVNTNRVSIAIHGVNDILTCVGTNRVGVAGVTAPTAPLDINGDVVRLRTAKTPASATDAGNQGDICWDANYMYVCVGTNTWRRSALATW